jgi:hypothetical protein
LFDLSPGNMAINFPNPRHTVSDIEGPVPRNVEFDPHLYYPPDVYRTPDPNWPRDFKIDLVKMIGTRIQSKVEAKAEDVVESAQETAEQLPEKINALRNGSRRSCKANKRRSVTKRLSESRSEESTASNHPGFCCGQSAKLP